MPEHTPNQGPGTESQADNGGFPCFDALDPKLQRFVIAYIEHRFNATRAAKSLGISQPEREGPRTAAKPHVRAAIEEWLSHQRMTANEVLAEIRAVSFVSMEDFVSVRTIKGKEKLVLDLKKAQKLKQIGAIREFKLGAEGELVSIKLHDRMRALETLAKATGIIRDTRDNEGGDLNVSDKKPAVLEVQRRGQIDDDERRKEAERLEGE